MRKLLITIMLCLATFCQAQIDESPVDQNASRETKDLYERLRNEIWGKRVISGCQAKYNYNIEEAEKVFKACGKYPSMNIFDFQHVGESWINYKKSIAADWHNQGGIVGFMWHIHMPKNVFSEFQNGWEGFYANGDKSTYIRPSKVLTEGTLENRLFKKKLQVVADHLLYYQEQGIPIIWRPIHEGSGKWFWWGCEGSEIYKQLYIYMFDYLLEAGVHNLIWVWTSQLDDDDWYPGDEYVDIIARDGYPSNNNSHMSQAADFNKLKKAHPNKMIALAECNSVPSWDNMKRDEALWLFVAPWCGESTMGNGNDANFWSTFLSEESVLARGE